MNHILIQNGQALLFNSDYTDCFLAKKDILIQDDKIAKIEDSIEKEDGFQVIDATDKIVMPGLINTHTHLPMSLFRETFEGCNLYTWLSDKIWPLEDKLTSEDVYYATMLSCIEQIRTGTTCSNDQYFFPNSIRKACEDSKVRAVLTRVLMDVNGEENAKQRLSEFLDFYHSRDEKNSKITYTVAPHSFYTCSDKCLEIAANLAHEFNLPVHTHYLESKKEIQDIQDLHHRPAIQILRDYFSDCKLILAHAVHLSSEDIEGFKTMHVGIAHNPVSNLRLGCGIADVTLYQKENILVGLGTDGQGSGSNLDLFESMRSACLIQGAIHQEDETRISAKDALLMATINGAKVLGLQDEIGSLEVGKQADIILIENDQDLSHIKSVPNHNQISNLVYNKSGYEVDTTICGGDILMLHRQITHIDVPEIIAKAKSVLF